MTLAAVVSPVLGEKVVFEVAVAPVAIGNKAGNARMTARNTPMTVLMRCI